MVFRSTGLDLCRLCACFQLQGMFLLWSRRLLDSSARTYVGDTASGSKFIELGYCIEAAQIGWVIIQVKAVHWNVLVVI